MARPLAESRIIGMRGPRQNFCKAPRRFGPFGPVQPDRVLILLIKADRAFRAVNFIGIAHLAPCRDTAEKHMPHRTIGKAAHHLCLIIIAYLTAGTVFIHGFNDSAHLDHRPQQCQCAIHHMRREIADGAIGIALSAPSGRGSRIAKKILGMFTPEPDYLTDRALGQQLRDVLAGRGADIVKADHIRLLRFSGQSHHLTALWT